MGGERNDGARSRYAHHLRFDGWRWRWNRFIEGYFRPAHEKIFKAMDTDKDGTVSIQRFKASCEEPESRLRRKMKTKTKTKTSVTSSK